MLEDMTSRIERSPGRSFDNPEDSWHASERHEQPIGGRLGLPGRAQLVAVSVAALAVLAPWLL